MCAGKCRVAVCVSIECKKYTEEAHLFFFLRRESVISNTYAQYNSGVFLHFPRAIRGPNLIKVYFLGGKKRGMPARTL